MDDKLTEAVIGCAMKVHRTLGPGFLESVYQNALSHELTKSNINHQSETAINVIYDDTVVGEFRADLLIHNTLIVELKAIENFKTVHEVQLVNYLSATRFDVGLLINFGAPSLQFKRKHRLRHPQENTSQPPSPIS